MEEIIKLFKVRLNDVINLVQETNKSSVLVIQQFPTEKDVKTLVPNIRESISNILGFIELGNQEVLDAVLELSDGVFDVIIFDADIKRENSSLLLEQIKKTIKKSKLFYYSDNQTWVEAAINFVLQIHGDVQNKNVLVTGHGILYEGILKYLELYNARIITESEHADIDLIIGAAIKEVSINESNFKGIITSTTKVFDMGIGNFSESFIHNTTKKGIDIYRIDIRAGISSCVLRILETDYMISHMMGKTQLAGVDIVAAGILGKIGAVVIDSINNPKHIIGVADGNGYLKSLFTAEDEKNIKFVTKMISN